MLHASEATRMDVLAALRSVGIQPLLKGGGRLVVAMATNGGCGEHRDRVKLGMAYSPCAYFGQNALPARTP